MELEGGRTESLSRHAISGASVSSGWPRHRAGDSCSDLVGGIIHGCMGKLRDCWRLGSGNVDSCPVEQQVVGSHSSQGGLGSEKVW